MRRSKPGEHAWNPARVPWQHRTHKCLRCGVVVRSRREYRKGKKSKWIVEYRAAERTHWTAERIACKATP